VICKRSCQIQITRPTYTLQSVWHRIDEKSQMYFGRGALVAESIIKLGHY